MYIIPYSLCFLLLVGGLCFFYLRKNKFNKQQRIQELQERIQTVRDGLSMTESSTPFSAKLSEAGITTKLQQTRIQLQSGTAGEPPEKYKFFSNMVAKGMEAEEIAEVLNISNTEASQLVQLCGLKECQD
jgi:DNA-directed RNA polymerase specialized sigma subunit